VDFLSLIHALDAPLGQDDHFKAAHLENLFRSKIAKSQATGKDGVRIGSFQKRLAEEAAYIERKVGQNAYKFTTFKERLILRGADREPRQISIPTVRDRLTLRAVCQVLHAYTPETVGSTPHALVNRVVKAIRSGQHSQESFVRVDVRDFFPSISHAILAKEIEHFGLNETVRGLCIQAVSTPTGTANTPTAKGIPQGLSISGALAALYMLRFDNLQLSRNSNYFRYVDDILLICDKRAADDALERIGRSLRARGLVIHKKGVAGKTEITPVSDGVDFLGYRICPEKVSIRKSSYRRMFKNVLKVVTDYRYRKDANRLIFRLNLKITGCIVDGRRRGWMMFFSRTEDMSQLAHLDSFIFRQLLRVGFPKSRISQIKRFVKSYYEIRYNLSDTVYIPNFDAFDATAKAQAVAALSNRGIEEVSAWDLVRLEQEFSRLISREVYDLEKDVGNPS
jgi:retron-type reverse transcriptase